jgi:hypothetical protein
MSLEQDIREDFAEDFLDTSEFGKTLTYQPNGGTSKPIKYFPLKTETHEVDEDDGKWRVREKVVSISSLSDEGVVEPDVLDKVTIDSEEWAIESIDSDSVAAHRLNLLRRELLERASTSRRRF